MTQTEILEALRKLTAMERIAVIQAALQQIRDDLQHREQPLAQVIKKQRLAMAAETLLPDYEACGELTIFTALDSEDIDAEG
jgi:nicotinamide mononucleotide adenylyltransferase